MSITALRRLLACIDDCKGHGTPIIKDRAECYVAMAEAEYALAAPLVRYCYECGSVGEVDAQHRDCCPDGMHATLVHPKIAAQARAGFRARLELIVSEQKAWDALGRYKFWTFAYNAAWWVKINRIIEAKLPNPWREIVVFAKSRLRPARSGC